MKYQEGRQTVVADTRFANAFSLTLEGGKAGKLERTRKAHASMRKAPIGRNQQATRLFINTLRSRKMPPSVLSAFIPSLLNLRPAESPSPAPARGNDN